MPTDPDDRSPASDTLLLDADAEQEAVLARIAAGQSLAVHTLPGTGGTQTVINAVGELVRAGKRVLVVSARRSTLEGVAHRLRGIHLDGLAVTPSRAAQRPDPRDRPQREGRAAERHRRRRRARAAARRAARTTATRSRSRARISGSRSST